MKSGLLIPLDTDKMKTEGWLNEAGQLCLKVNAKQYRANRLFVHDDQWYVLYHSGSPMTTAPLVMNWRCVAKDEYVDTLTTQIITMGSFADRTVVYRDNEETMDTDIHATCDNRELFLDWWLALRTEWDDVVFHFHSMEFITKRPKSKRTLYASGTWFIESSEDMDASFVDQILTEGGYKPSHIPLVEQPLRQKRDVPHPLSSMGQLIDYLTQAHDTLPRELQTVLSNGLYDELKTIQQDNEGRRTSL